MTVALITQHLKELHMPTIRECFSELAEMARREGLSYEAYLSELLEREIEVRRKNRIERLLRESRLPLEKNFDNFDFSWLTPKLRHQVSVLRDGSFLDRRENLLAFGQPGTGKSHLLCAIAQELVYKGRRILHSPCSFLVQDLLNAKRELKLKSYIRKLAKFDAILIDDIGYVEQSREEMEVLFTLLADRYERASVMITSNLTFSKWEKIFKDPMTTAAAIDRLVHHSVILELDLLSYRLEHSTSKLKATGGDEQ